MPNPPKPTEQKRLLGNPGKRPLPVQGNVVPLPMARETPPTPPKLGRDGRRLWKRSWDEAITWLSPHSDIERVEQACRLADDLAIARERYRSTREPVDARIVATLARELGSALSELGFTPVARTRMGVAEVVRVSKLEALRRGH